MNTEVSRGACRCRSPCRQDQRAVERPNPRPDQRTLAGGAQQVRGIVPPLVPTCRSAAKGRAQGWRARRTSSRAQERERLMEPLGRGLHGRNADLFLGWALHCRGALSESIQALGAWLVLGSHSPVPAARLRVRVGARAAVMDGAHHRTVPSAHTSCATLGGTLWGTILNPSLRPAGQSRLLLRHRPRG